MIKGFPEEIRASWLSRSWWCHEESRIKATSGGPRGVGQKETKAMTVGLEVHEQLAARKFPPEVVKLERLLAANAPLYGIFEGTRIYIHPDEHRIKDLAVSIVEHKTTSRMPGIYQTCQSTFQVKTYVYVEKQILPKLGYRGGFKHRVMYWKRPTKTKPKLRLLKVVPVIYYGWEFEDDLHLIFEVWRGNRAPIPPALWKCGQCHPFYRTRCRFYTGEAPLSKTEWNKRFMRRKKK